MLLIASRWWSYGIHCKIISAFCVFKKLYNNMMVGGNLSKDFTEKLTISCDEKSKSR